MAGLLSQAGLVLGYSVASELRGFPVGARFVVIWLVTGAIAGPVFGAAGALLRDGRRRIRTAAAGVTGSVWLIEGAYFLSLATDDNSSSGPGTTAGWCYLCVGVLLPVALARSVRDRAYAVLALLVSAGAAGGALALVSAAFLA